MNQKYILSFIVAFYFTISFGQNNAVNLTSDNTFRVSGGEGMLLGTIVHLGFNGNTFTIEYDFYLNSMSNYNARFFAGQASNVRPFDFYIDNTGTSHLILGDGSSTETIPGTPSFIVGQWYHVAFVVNNTATKNIKMFVNGNLSVDFNFTQGVIGDDYTNISIGSRTYNSGDCKFDNLRIWNVLRTNSEILNNYNNCLTNTETGLIAYFNFDRSNNGTFRNRVLSSSLTNGLLYGSHIFSSGTGCTIPELGPSVEVTGDYAGIYYVIGTLNGKPHYKTDEIECNFTAESSCDTTQDAYQIYWDNTQWVLAPADCTWAFTSCDNSIDPFNTGTLTILGTNPSSINFAPCSGWTFTDSGASSIFSSNDCTALSTPNLEFNKNVSVYPNPTKDYLNIETKETISLEILNLLGEIIISNPKLDGLNKIKLDNLSSGIYILKVTNLNQETISFKIIKDK